MRTLVLGAALFLSSPAVVLAGGWFEVHGGMARLEMEEFNQRVDDLNELEYAWELPKLEDELEGGASFVIPFGAGVKLGVGFDRIFARTEYASRIRSRLKDVTADVHKVMLVMGTDGPGGMSLFLAAGRIIVEGKYVLETESTRWKRPVSAEAEMAEGGVMIDLQMGPHSSLCLTGGFRYAPVEDIEVDGEVHEGRDLDYSGAFGRAGLKFWF